MLTSDQTKLRIKVLIVLNSIALAAISGAIAITIIGQYYGFSQNSPITTCTSAYFVTKFISQNNFLSVSFVGQILAFTGSLIFLIDLIVSWIKVGKTEDNQINKITQNSIIHFYILASLSALGCMIALGYIGSIIIEANSKCGTSIGTNQLIIAATTGLAEILFVICLIIIIKLSSQLDTVEQQKKEVEKDVKAQVEDVKKEEEEVVKVQQMVGDLSIIKEISMIREQENKSVQKNIDKLIQGQINKQEQKMPLLNKSFYEQYKQNSEVGKEKMSVEMSRQTQLRKSKISANNQEVRNTLNVDHSMQQQRKNSTKTIAKSEASLKEASKTQKQSIYRRQKLQHSQSQYYKIQKQPQIKIHKQPSQRLYQNKNKEQASKIQKVEVEVKPTPSQNTTHVTINFPTMQSGNFLPQVNSQNNYQLAANSQPHTNDNNGKAKKTKIKRQQQQVIRQTMEQEQNQDSDDYYYKRQRKSKKRNFNFEKEKEKEKEGSRSNKKGKNYYQKQPNYQRQFQRTPRRFQQAPSQPRYIVLSPESVRTFEEFLKEQTGNKQKNRQFQRFEKKQPLIQRQVIVKQPSQKEIIKQEKIQARKEEYNIINKQSIDQIKQQKKQQIKQQIMINKQIKSSISSEIKKQDKKLSKKRQSKKSLKKQHKNITLQSSQSHNNQYYQSEVKQFLKPEQRNTKYSKLKQFDSKQKSIYQKLNVVADSQEQQFKKYKQFFKSNRQIQRQQPSSPHQSLQQYFNLLNSRVGNGNENSYNSLSNYSSVLNEQSKGKIPQQRENNTNKKINLDKKKLESNRKSKANIIQKIRNKYN